MYCKKPSPVLILLINTLIVFIMFMLIDYIYYGLLFPGPDPYTVDLSGKIIYTVLFAVVYAHLYNKCSRIWRPNSKEAFLHNNKVVPDTQLCDLSTSKILNSIAFSLLTSGVILLAMFLCTYVVTTVYIYVLQGFHGVPEDSGDSLLFVSKVVAAGVVMESHGKTEDDPDR